MLNLAQVSIYLNCSTQYSTSELNKCENLQLTWTGFTMRTPNAQLAWS